MKATPYLAALALAAAFAPAAHADDDWSFKDISIQHLDWTSHTENQTGKGPFGVK